MKIQVTSSACSGCRLCRQICAIEKFAVENPRRARLRVEARFPSPGTYHPQVCDQCGECAEACPTEAIAKNDAGVYSVDKEQCSLCGACVDACPTGVMMWPDESEPPYKCDFCLRCVEVCNTGALKWAE